MRRKERVGRKVKGAEGERWLGGEGRVICSHATVKINIPKARTSCLYKTFCLKYYDTDKKRQNIKTYI